MDIAAGEGHDRIPADQLVEIGGNALDAQPALALEDLHLQRLAGHGEQVLDERDRLRRAREHHEAGGSADHGLGPGPAAARIAQHLDLVDDADIDDPVQIQRLDGAGDMGRAFGQHSLLAGDHARGKTVLAHALVMLERQQAQGREHLGGLRLAGELQRLVGLARIGRPREEQEAAVQGAGDGEDRRVALIAGSLADLRLAQVAQASRSGLGTILVELLTQLAPGRGRSTLVGGMDAVELVEGGTDAAENRLALVRILIRVEIVRELVAPAHQFLLAGLEGGVPQTRRASLRAPLRRKQARGCPTRAGDSATAATSGGSAKANSMAMSMGALSGRICIGLPNTAR